MTPIPALTGLRAVAVLAVIAYHAGLPIPGGFVGVDVFFVISGYLITRLLVTERESGRIDFLAFYARRVRRIFPAAAVVVLAVLVASLFLLGPEQRAHTSLSAGSALVFAANVFFQFKSGGYFDAAAGEMPLLHLWSLSVEEQFYFAWPLLIAAVPVRWLRPVMVGLALASFALCEWLDGAAAFYQMPARAWELAAGGIIATLPMRALPRWCAPVGLLAVVVGCLTARYSGFGVLPAVAGAAVLIAALHGGASNALLASRPMVAVGLISYSLYLWHWPLLALDKALRVGESPLAVRLALCALAVVLAALSYRYVEQPFRRSRARSGRVVATGLACVVALSCTAFALANTQPAPKAVAVMSDTCAGPLKAARCVGNVPKVVLWGDSYAGAWESVAVSLAKSQGMTAVQMVETGCPPVLGVDVPRNTERASRFCRERAARDVAYLQANGADTLLVTAHWTRLLRERPDAGAGVVAWAKALPNVRRIVVVGPTPELLDAVEKCQAIGKSCDIPRASFDRSAEAAAAVMRELSALPNVEVLPLGDWLCDATACPGVRDGVALYERDNHHVSRAAVAEFLRGRGLVGMAARQE